MKKETMNEPRGISDERISKLLHRLDRGHRVGTGDGMSTDELRACLQSQAQLAVIQSYFGEGEYRSGLVCPFCTPDGHVCLVHRMLATNDAELGLCRKERDTLYAANTALTAALTRAREIAKRRASLQLPPSADDHTKWLEQFDADEKEIASWPQ